MIDFKATINTDCQSALFIKFIFILPALDVSILTQDQLTLHHTKLFGAYNHLVQDPWVDRSVYFIDTDWAVQNIFIHEVYFCANWQKVVL